ncbi:MAG: hypothetical protein ACOVQ2_09900 [Flavobacterium sp.]
MVYILVILALNILYIFYFKREYLNNNKTFIIILIFNLFLFLLSIIINYTNYYNSENIKLLKVPIISQIIYFALLSVFRKLYNRDPKDTFWSMDIKLMKDGIFNFIFLILGILIPIILIYL